MGKLQLHHINNLLPRKGKNSNQAREKEHFFRSTVPLKSMQTQYKIHFFIGTRHI